MAVEETTVRPPYSVILIGDPAATVPTSMAGRLVSATESCVAVGTRSDVDGPARIRLADIDDRLRGLPPTLAFSGTLAIKNELTIASVDDQVYLRKAVAGPRVHVRVYVDSDAEPADICVVAEELANKDSGSWSIGGSYVDRPGGGPSSADSQPNRFEVERLSEAGSPAFLVPVDAAAHNSIAAHD